MTKTEFNKLLKVITTKKFIDVKKINQLSNDDRSNMVYFIVRNRMPVLKDLIPDNFDFSWLHSMGYLYITAGKQYTFIHTCEHKIL